MTYHALDSEQTLQQLNSDREGLTTDEAGPLVLRDWLVVVGLALAPAIVGQIVKLVSRTRKVTDRGDAVDAADEPATAAR